MVVKHGSGRTRLESRIPDRRDFANTEQGGMVGKQKAVHGSNLHGQQSVHCPSKTMNSEKCRNQSVHRKLTLSTPANCLPRVSNIYSHRASGTRGRLGIGRSVHRPAYSVAWSLSYENPVDSQVSPQLACNSGEMGSSVTIELGHGE